MILLRFGLAAIATCLLAATAIEQWGLRRDRRRFPPPGRRLAAGENTLHVHASGSGAPAVILDAGLAASSLSWTYVQQRVGAFTTVLSYDRAGLGWSELSRERRSLHVMVRELSAALDAGGFAPPYILAGHSFGSLVVRAFAQRHPADVAGMVLVDPVSIRQWCACSETDRRRIRLGARLSRRGAWLARFGVVRFALWMAALQKRGVAKSIARVSAGKGNSMLGRLVGEVRKLPPELLPVIRAHWSAGKSFRAMAEYLACLPECAAEAAAMPFATHIPLIVLSAGSATQAELEERAAWIEHHSFSRHTQLKDTGHWLHLERPDAVAAAIRELVERSRSSVRHGVDDVIHSDSKT